MPHPPAPAHAAGEDAETQTAVQAEVAWGMGLIDGVQRKVAEQLQEEIIELVSDRGGGGGGCVQVGTDSVGEVDLLKVGILCFMVCWFGSINLISIVSLILARLSLTQLGK